MEKMEEEAATAYFKEIYCQLHRKIEKNNEKCLMIASVPDETHTIYLTHTSEISITT
jgi:hypothetical protein